MALKGSEHNAKVRVLLVVWSETQRVGALNKRVTRSGEKAEDYKPILEQLKTGGAIAEEKKDLLSISAAGVVLLRAMLSDVQFDFTNDSNAPDPKKPGETKKVGQIGAKFGDALLQWIRAEAGNVKSEPAILIDFDTFTDRFKQIYLAERKTQELHGTVAIYANDICQKFASQHSISNDLLGEYYQKLISSNKIIAFADRDGEMIQWVN